MAKDTAYKNMSTEELTQELAKLRRELQETRFAHAVSPIAGPHVIKEMRRDIARFMTELHARTQAAHEAAGTAPKRDRIRARRASRRKEVARQRRKAAQARRK
jgi:ribosomal protein L29